MDDRRKKSIDLVADVTKQLVTLSAAIVTFMTTIYKQEIHDHEPGVLLSVGFAVASVIGGLVVLALLAGTVADISGIQESEISVSDPRIKWPALLQMILFVFALIILIGFVAF
jgi:hypothetical protein